MAELVHPGYINLREINREVGMSGFSKKVDEIREARKFEDFRPFINTETLTEENSRLFQKFLERLFKVSGGYWEPTRCELAESLGADVRKVILDMNSGKLIKEEGVRRADRAHFWVEINIGNSESIIIDPFGIPEDFPITTGPNNKILPYFGSVSKARESAQKVYLKGVPLDDWGTRSLPPGFHP